MKSSSWVKLISSCLVLLAQGALAAQKSVYVYSARKEHLVKPLFDAYEKETGVQIKYTTDKGPALMAKIKSEGKRSQADIYFTVDAGNLWNASKQGILRSIQSQKLNQNIPEHLRDPQGQWYGLSVRARTIAYSTKRVQASELKNYEDLADKRWKGRLCLRTSKKVYNQSLVAMFIADKGMKPTEQMVSGWVDNLAAKVFPNDTAVLKAIASGQCDVGIVNSYYYARIKNEKKKFPVALFWPKKSAGGVHVNISGAGVTKFAPHPQEAQKLLEWLSSDKAQTMFAQLNFEFPAKIGVPSADLVKSWGPYQPNTMNVSKAGALQAEAVKLMDRVGYR